MPDESYNNRRQEDRRLSAIEGSLERNTAEIGRIRTSLGDRFTTLMFELDNRYMPRGAPNGLSTATTIQNPATTVVLNAGDYVELWVQQTSGTSPLNVNVSDTGIGVPTVFGMEKIG